MGMTDKSSHSSKSLGNVLITGGCGFLGHKLASLLQQRQVCESITILDLRPPRTPLDKVQYHQCDITDFSSVKEIFNTVKPRTVFHTASPIFNINDNKIMYDVNVIGTQTVVKASKEASVTAFIYTSSASVISDNKADLVNADESYPYCMGADQPEYYTTTKAEAEIHVLASNSPPDAFFTAAIRPSGIFGVGDVQLLPPGLSAYFRGQTRFQIGNNDNLFDFTEVTNVVHAHHLAAVALLETHERNRKGESGVLDNEKVDGEAFIITNDQPVYFYDFARLCWVSAGDETKMKDVWVLSRDFGLFIASLFEWLFWILGLVAGMKKKPNLTRQQVRFSCMTRYYDITKAKRRLGYSPIVSLTEGVKRGVADVLTRGAVPGMPDDLKGKVPDKLKRDIALMDKKHK